MAEDRDLVAIAVFDSLSEAEVARSLLDAEGIDVVLRDQPLASLLPAVALANGGLALLVSAEDAEVAHEILATPDDADADGDLLADELLEPDASGEQAGL